MKEKNSITARLALNNYSGVVEQFPSRMKKIVQKKVIEENCDMFHYFH